MKQLLLICAVVALVGCLREVETEGQDVKDEPSIPEGNELPPEPPTNTPVQPKTEPKAEAKKPLTKEESAKVIEAAIRDRINKPTGELTKADLEKITRFYLNESHLTDVKGLEKLTKLERLGLENNPDLTQAQIDELKKALPKCKIFSNPKN